MAVRVGAQIHPQHAEYAQMRDTWLRVEEMGADTLFNWDHFYPLYGEPEGKHFECSPHRSGRPARRTLRSAGAYRPV
jgi:hypothetical protein